MLRMSRILLLAHIILLCNSYAVKTEEEFFTDDLYFDDRIDELSDSFFEVALSSGEPTTTKSPTTMTILPKTTTSKLFRVFELQLALLLKVVDTAIIDALNAVTKSENQLLIYNNFYDLLISQVNLTFVD